MHPIAAALLIVAAVLLLNGGMLRQAFADDRLAPLPAPMAALPPLAPRGGKLLGLLLVLESLRQAPVPLAAHKV